MKILLQSPKRLLWLVSLIFSICAVSAQSTETYRFTFYPGNDMFYASAENAPELQRLIDKVIEVRDLINDGQASILVDGYSSTSLAVATVRSNRVKSEVIVRGNVVEECFTTRNHIQGDSVVVVLQLPPRRPGPPKPVVIPKENRNDDVVVKPVSPVEADEEIWNDTVEVIEEHSRVCPISLRFNLLRWATLTPDLGLQWDINDRWTILADASWTSWSWDGANRRYALGEVTAEVRYRFRKAYVGAHLTGGSFNYKLSDTGRQGDLYGGGITAGYVVPLSKHFKLDFGVGLGYMRIDAEKYYLANGNRVRSAYCDKNWWGPTRLGVTLVYNFN